MHHSVQWLLWPSTIPLGRGRRGAVTCYKYLTWESECSGRSQNLNNIQPEIHQCLKDSAFLTMSASLETRYTRLDTTLGALFIGMEVLFR